MNKDYEHKQIGRDLIKLANLLSHYGLCNDTGPLHKAGSNCMVNATDTTWWYSLEKIVFSADEVNDMIANDCCDISVSLSMELIKGQFRKDGKTINPLSDLYFDLEVDGFRLNPTTDGIDPLYSAWHLDRHIFSAGDPKAHYSHPLYHLTFGGNKMIAKGHDTYGNAIIMPSPRILYPPMDAVLGVDFILQNYKTKGTIKKLVEDPEYKEIIVKSQERIWKPFFCSVYSHFNKGIDTFEDDFGPLKLMPLYY